MIMIQMMAGGRGSLEPEARKRTSSLSTPHRFYIKLIMMIIMMMMMVMVMMMMIIIIILIGINLIRAVDVSVDPAHSAILFRDARGVSHFNDKCTLIFLWKKSRMENETKKHFSCQSPTPSLPSML